MQLYIKIKIRRFPRKKRGFNPLNIRVSIFSRILADFAENGGLYKKKGKNGRLYKKNGAEIGKFYKIKCENVWKLWNIKKTTRKI